MLNSATPFSIAMMLVCATTALAQPNVLSATAIEAAAFQPPPEKPLGRATAEFIRAEILLARAKFSPGSIDGQDGDNLRHALAAFQRSRGLPVSGSLDQATWDGLVGDKAPVMTRYEITAADAKGPYTPVIPAKFEQQARLKRMGYRNIREALAERFHMSPTLLVALNPRQAFGAGETIDVAAIEPVALQGAPPSDKATSIVVDKTDHQIEAFAQDGRLLAVYPASIGSEEKPAPSGRFEINRIAHHPDYTYLPRFHFKGVASKQPFTIAPGPNNPVGVVWMDLSFEGYGIHGTPEPELVGKTQSHGCIRLTNWDADALAALADKGTAVTFQEGPDNPVPQQPAPQGTPAPLAGTPGAAMP